VLKELKDSSEADLRRTRYGFGGPVSKSMSSGNAGRKQPHFGFILASCERADLRPSADGVLVYGDAGVSEVPAVQGNGAYGQGDTIDELYDAITGRAPVLRNAEWGRDTVRVCLAVLKSSVTGEQIMLEEIA
jgi:phthalate 4,5-cis-dihydrodiol dehydrogenase